MNDDEMLATMRSSLTGIAESLTDVHLEQPVSTIHARARDHRLRRGLAGLAGVGTAGLALSLGLALAAGGSSGSRHPGNPLANARLAAWTVAKQANGDIDVTVRQLKNPAGLQSTLRADGVPVNVSFTGQSMTGSCQFYPMSNNVLNAVAKTPSASRIEGGTLFVINPSALPAGAGLDMEVGGITHNKLGYIVYNARTNISVPSSVPPGTGGSVSQAIGEHALEVTPVYASQQCTG
jgi:hypothetical protein